ncbi:MAG: hypothetical protein FJ035_01945 [Chloroflexi bacterium]|nr:hypothetical protein [Chloroflexota bacterium]
MASAVCLLIALGTGVAGALADAAPEPPRPPASADAASPFHQLGGMLRVPRVPGLGGDDARDVPPPAAPASRALPVEVQAPAELADARIAVERQPLAPRRPQLQVQALALAARRLAPGDRVSVPVSFYYCEESAGGESPRGDGGSFCGHVRDGSRVRPGMAACDYAYLGQRFRIEGDPTGRVYVCGDTGSAIHGLARDIWFMDNRSGWLWQRVVGTSAVIEILSPE